MSHPTVRVPPDSTGKRVATGCALEFQYSGATGTMHVGDLLTASTSGVLGHISKLVESSPTAGTITVDLHHGAPEAVVVSETVTATGIGEDETATVVNVGTPYYITKTINVGQNNSFNGQHVDSEGAASVRFIDGSPTLNSFGSLLAMGVNTVGVYDFSADGAVDLFSSHTASGGNISYDSDKSVVSLNCTTASGSLIHYSTNKYHFYWPGRGLGAIMTVASSDLGVTGNQRQWGLFDDSDGVFFELSGSTVNVVVRSSVSGTKIDTRVKQVDWNLDKLDGTGLSREVLHVNKITPYFIDYQWLGAGRVRFGIVGSKGNRIYCHTVENSGQNLYPYMKRGSLPLSNNNENFQLLGASPSLRITCMAVQTEGAADYTYWRYSQSHPQKSVSGSLIPLISVRSKVEYFGKHNQTNVYPETYTCHVSGSAVRLDFYWPITLQGDTWAQAAVGPSDGGTLEIDTAATGSVVDADSWAHFTEFVSPGSHTVQLRDTFEINDEGILTQAHGGESIGYSVVATVIGGGNAVVNGSLTYKELR